MPAPKPPLAAENLLLGKQLALYQERDVTPRYASNATRFTSEGGVTIATRCFVNHNSVP
jgi:hypothetical protein